MSEWIERARQLGNEVYPKLVALLAEDRSSVPRRFDVVFHKRIDGNVGQTVGTTIRLNADWFAKNPTGLDAVLIHEMTHVVQQGVANAPAYWIEGVADYACYKLGYTNRWSVPECSAAYPHYTAGYCCAGAFLLFMDRTYGSNVIRQLTAELRRGIYSDAFFERATGKSLPQLWSEFEKTPAFTPIAAEINKVRQTLGYTNGHPSQDLAARFRAYVEQQPGGALTIEATEFITDLAQKDQLPGLKRKERPPGAPKHRLSVAIPPTSLLKETSSAAFPATRTFYCTRTEDPSTYHYVVFRASRDTPWTLQKAWQSARDGRVLEEYQIPSAGPSN